LAGALKTRKKEKRFSQEVEKNGIGNNAFKKKITERQVSNGTVQKGRHREGEEKGGNKEKRPTQKGTVIQKH